MGKKDIYDLLTQYSKQYQLYYHGCTPVPDTCAWDFEIVQGMYRKLTKDGTGYKEFKIKIDDRVLRDMLEHPYIYTTATEAQINLIGLRYYMVVYFRNGNLLHFIINIVDSNGIDLQDDLIERFKAEIKVFFTKIEEISSESKHTNISSFGRREPVYANRRI